MRKSLCRPWTMFMAPTYSPREMKGSSWDSEKDVRVAVKFCEHLPSRS